MTIRKCGAILMLFALLGVAAAQPTPSPKPAKRPKSSASPAEKSSAGKNPLADLGSGQNKGPTEITAKQEMQFDAATRVAVFLGPVKVVDPDFTMTSDKLTVQLEKQENGGGLRQADAEGNVIIVHANQPKNNKTTAESSPSATAVPTAETSPAAGPQASPALVLSTGRGQKAVYVAKEGSITLTGWPQVTEGINTHISTEEGTKMVMFKDGRMKTYGGSRTVIQDKSQMGRPQANASQ